MSDQPQETPVTPAPAKFYLVVCGYSVDVYEYPTREALALAYAGAVNSVDVNAEEVFAFEGTRLNLSLKHATVVAFEGEDPISIPVNLEPEVDEEPEAPGEGSTYLDTPF